MAPSCGRGWQETHHEILRIGFFLVTGDEDKTCSLCRTFVLQFTILHD
jgi:hypothetical protein